MLGATKAIAQAARKLCLLSGKIHAAPIFANVAMSWPQYNLRCLNLTIARKKAEADFVLPDSTGSSEKPKSCQDDNSSSTVSQMPWFFVASASFVGAVSDGVYSEAV